MGQPQIDAAELEVGEVLGNKYRLDAQIGRGAMGTVWLATHLTLEQKVAVKVISPEHANSPELRRRFDTEARAAAKLRSRFVVQVYDHGETVQGLPYIVMEYLEGEALEDRIARLGTIPPREAGRIARHVGRALSRAHERGIVHRDLKPANIFIAKGEDEEDEWVAKVLDFGVAKVEDFADRSTTKTGAVLGTPLFMSPEQVRGASNVDSRADLYSLGMVVYNMITGDYAFEGQSFGDLLVSICTDPLPRLSDSAPNVPPAIDDWFAKTCAREADDRYQTADELVQALSEAIGTVDDARSSVAEVGIGARTVQFASRQLAETRSADEVAQSGVTIGSSHTDPAPATAETNGPAETNDGVESASPLTLAGSHRKRRLIPALAAGVALAAVGGYLLAKPSAPEAAASSPTVASSSDTSAQADEERADSSPEEDASGDERATAAKDERDTTKEADRPSKNDSKKAAANDAEPTGTGTKKASPTVEATTSPSKANAPRKPAVRRRPTTTQKTSNSSPSPAPKPAAKPAPSPPSKPDLGF